MHVGSAESCIHVLSCVHNTSLQPLSNMVAAGKTVFVTFDDATSVQNDPNLWPGNTIYNTYADSPVLHTMEAFNVQQVCRDDAINAIATSWTPGGVLGRPEPIPHFKQ